ncbi:MAG: metallophosphoesterase [Alphaproteobacteria bacterium]|nr:metallophosphoesterase [Alphaproteobacteria bacterium]
MVTDSAEHTRRGALKCLAAGGAGTLFALSGGVFQAIDLALGATAAAVAPGQMSFVQISDSHIGFKGEANRDVAATVARSIDLVNALPTRPSLIIHTGDITHLSKPAEFDMAQQLLSRLAGELHTVPGEHDVIDGPGKEYFARFGKSSDGRGYYSFDNGGVHFVALINVMNFKANGLGALGDDQLAWLENDLNARSSSTPIVVFAHMPLWSVYEPWGWGTGDADRAMAALRRFGSVTVLNGHIHQIMQKVEGNITFHTARSMAYPQPRGGDGPGPGPLMVSPDLLPKMLGITSIRVTATTGAASISDTPLA